MPDERRSVPRELRKIAPWAALFAVLLVAIWTAVQSQQTPYIILTVLLYLITINFSAPLPYGTASLVPVISISSFLIWGLPTAVMILGSAILFSSLVAPLWDPLWESAGFRGFSWGQRIVTGAVYLAALLVAAALYQNFQGITPLNETAAVSWPSFIALSLGYGIVYLAAAVAFWIITQESWQGFPLLAHVASGLLSHPFSFLGGIITLQNGLPAFVLYGLVLVVISIFSWLSWHRDQVLIQRYFQLSVLNVLGKSLHETMDLDAIIRAAYKQLGKLFNVDNLTVTLADHTARQSNGWKQYSSPCSDNPDQPLHLKIAVQEPSAVDGLTRWVMQHVSTLNLHERSLHFAEDRQLLLPKPRPAAWLGAPMYVGTQLIGAISLQRNAVGSRFDRWNEELLQAIAGHLGSAIHNASLYSESMRLFNLTDTALTYRLEQLQALMDTMNEGVLMLDRSSRIVLLNAMAADLLGNAQPSVWLGNLLDQHTALTVGFDAESYDAMVADLESGHLKASTAAVFQPTPETMARHIQRLDSSVTDDSGNLMGWLMLFRDITKEVKTTELRNDLTRTIVHDLRNPLTTLNSNLDLARHYLTRDPANHAPIEEQLLTATQVCADTLDMVDSLMDIGRLEAGQDVVQAEAMRIPSLLERILDRLSPLASSKQIAISLDYPDDLPPIWADEELLRRVLINLLDNALKFTPSGGFVSVTLAPESVDDGARDPGIRCTIDDSGPGVPAQFRDTVFERYTRIRPSPENHATGTGLGLFYCKLAIEAHGGRIWIEDSPESFEGSSFVFTLPGIPHFP